MLHPPFIITPNVDIIFLCSSFYRKKPGKIINIVISDHHKLCG